MSIRKIGDLPKQTSQRCLDPEHKPPSHWCPEPGTYEHTCPSCGKKTTLVIDRGWM